MSRPLKRFPHVAAAVCFLHAHFCLRDCRNLSLAATGHMTYIEALCVFLCFFVYLLFLVSFSLLEEYVNRRRQKLKKNKLCDVSVSLQQVNATGLRFKPLLSQNRR